MSAIARQKTGVEFVDYGEVGFRHLLSKRPVEALSELGGLKIRVPEIKIWVDFWKKLGANPTPMAYSEQYSALSKEIRAATDEVFASQRFILGPKLTEFEKAAAEYCGAPHGIGVSSGTDALLAVFMALDQRRGALKLAPASAK